MSHQSNMKYATHYNVAELMTEWMRTVYSGLQYGTDIYQIASNIDNFVAFLPARIRDAMMKCLKCSKPLYSKNGNQCLCGADSNPMKMIELMVQNSIKMKNRLLKLRPLNADHSVNIMSIKTAVNRQNMEMARTIISYLQDAMEREGMSFFAYSEMKLVHEKPSENTTKRRVPTPVLK